MHHSKPGSVKSRIAWFFGGVALITTLVIAVFVSQRDEDVVDGCFAEEPAGTTVPLFVVRLDGREGFINRSGKLVIPVRFDKVYPFTGGLAGACVNEKWGYIDESGTWAIEPRFAMAGPFSEGFAVVRLSFDEPYGYIDQEGNVAIEPQFDAAGPFIDGYARVGSQTWANKLKRVVPADVGLDCKYFYIDRTGQHVDASSVPPGTGQRQGAGSRLRPFKAEGKMGFVDENGIIAVAAKYDHVYEFENGLARFTIEGGEKSGYIDESGQVVWEASE